MNAHDADPDLDECRRELSRLAEENAQLRASASAFADLAERLSHALTERRIAADRRSVPNPPKRAARFPKTLSEADVEALLAEWRKLFERRKAA